MAGSRVDYGVDAPRVIRNLLLGALAAALIAVFAFPVVNVFGIKLQLRNIAWVTFAICAGEALLMLLYAKVGKYLHRDRMLALHDWRGDEQVLDVGSGRGLLAIGAAKRVPHGRAVGLDIWNAKDLSGNTPDAAWANAMAEGVAGRVSFDKGDIRRAPFDDESFDLVVSNLCLHNIREPAGRERACREIHRVLKPGGRAIVSDFRNVGDYERTFAQLGMRVERRSPSWFSTFPPLAILTAAKT